MNTKPEVNVEKRPFASYVGLHVLALFFIAVAAVAGVLLLRHPHGNATLVAGGVLVGSAALGYLGMLIANPIVRSLNGAREQNLKAHQELLAVLDSRLQELSVMVNLVSEQQLLSDRAKVVAFREKDREAVRRAVREEIGRQDWEAALVLADDIEKSFGYRQEADRFRQEILDKRNELQRKQIAEMLLPVDHHVKAEAWGSALQEAQKIMAAFPDDEQVQRLPQEIESRRQGRKKQLLDSWKDAVNRHDVDGSIETLKKLDLYLTPAEAESMQNDARNIFKEKKDGLRAHFALAVQEHRWQEAFRLGDELIQEFPNTRFAQEVRERMEALHNLAEQPEAAKTP